jgi:hypothetical protein
MRIPAFKSNNLFSFARLCATADLAGVERLLDVAARLMTLKKREPDEQAAQAILGEVRKFVTYCADFFALTSDDK